MLAKIRRELSRLIFPGLMLTYGLAALAVCGAGNCDDGLQTAVPAILDEMRGYLWHGMAPAYAVEFAGGIVGMTIGLAWDWWKQRPVKAAAKARAEALAEARADARVEAPAEIRELRERMLRIGIDPDTGARLPHFNSGPANGQAGN